MLGNRGILHNEHKEIVRSSQVRRWICCVLQFKGIRRTVMKARSYTELFFLDEATALAAGHRPCFECRRPAAVAFQSAWARAFGTADKADAMDAVLSRDRRMRGGCQKSHLADVQTLPEGVFVVWQGVARLLHRGRLWRWTPSGYRGSEALGAGRIEVLTPRATTQVLQAGYVAAVHPSAGLARGPLA